VKQRDANHGIERKEGKKTVLGGGGGVRQHALVPESEKRETETDLKRGMSDAPWHVEDATANQEGEREKRSEKKKKCE